MSLSNYVIICYFSTQSDPHLSHQNLYKCQVKTSLHTSENGGKDCTILINIWTESQYQSNIICSVYNIIVLTKLIFWLEVRKMTRHVSGSNHVTDEYDWLGINVIIFGYFYTYRKMTINYTTNINTLTIRCHKSEK